MAEMAPERRSKAGGAPGAVTTGAVTKSSLEKLIALAEEPSSDKRRELLREVSDLLFGAPASYSAVEMKLFGDVLTALLDHVEGEARQQFAEQLADAVHAPANLVRKLANGEPLTAVPVLQRSPVLSEADLVNAVRKRSAAHASAIANREQLSEAVSEALADRPEEAVVRALVQNAGARINRKTMEKIVDRSQGARSLQAPLLTRGDLPPDLMNDMFFFVSETLREYILRSNANLDPVKVHTALTQARDKAVSDIAEENEKRSEAEKIIDGKEKRKELTENYLVTLLKNDDLDLFVLAFARMTTLDRRVIERIVEKAHYEALAVACRASRFDRATFSKLVLLLEPETARSGEEVCRLLNLYDKVTHEVAQRTIRFWRVRAGLGNGQKAA